MKYSVAANIVESDAAFPIGTKVHIVCIEDGFERFRVFGLNMAGRYIGKWIPISRLADFRSETLPDYLHGILSKRPYPYMRGTKKETDDRITLLQILSEQYRAEHPNRLK